MHRHHHQQCRTLSLLFNTCCLYYLLNIYQQIMVKQFCQYYQDKWGGGKIFVCEGRCCDDGDDQLWACCRLCSVFSARWRKARGYKRWKVSAAVSSPVYTPPSPAASRELQRWYRPVLLPTLHLDTIDYWCWCAVIKNMRFLLFKAIINCCHIHVRYVLRITTVSVPPQKCDPIFRWFT